ncbi:hypothetical protein [Cohnella silvisoli]|uniref:Uncharacterized protein n=1 Tax=Cohnella silvisoli TaxID=2873699 RepID=A0ABV1KQD7_9BACL|nr:hypothetical protein [Cohnella silvisoli]MCD9022060.1 hypothetical protein [Cohnella silvisoli]
MAATQLNTQMAIKRNPRVSTPKHYITIVFGMWLIGGIFVDGYAHNHGVVETFFTPWHAILYSGFIASAIWMTWLLYLSRRATGLPWLQAAPIGYGLGLVGVVVFLAGGVGDMIWHIVFGIEQDTAALLSPTHLVLLVGAVLILSSPYRAEWHNKESKEPRWREFAPPFLSVVITMGAASFFLMYAWMFRFNLSAQPVVDWYWSTFSNEHIIEVNETRGLTYTLLDTILYMFPILLLMKRWKLPFGAIMALFAIITIMMNVLDGFEGWRTILVAMAAGLIGDLVYHGLRPYEGRMWAYRVVAFITPVALWTIYYIWMFMLTGIGWSVELWTGSVVEAGLVSLGLSVLALSPKRE